MGLEYGTAGPGYTCGACGVFVMDGTSHQCLAGTGGVNSYGYTCPQCGSWVQYGVMHSCGSYAGSSVITNSYEATLRRIATALERIAAVLESKDGQDPQA